MAPAMGYGCGNAPAMNYGCGSCGRKKYGGGAHRFFKDGDSDIDVHFLLRDSLARNRLPNVIDRKYGASQKKKRRTRRRASQAGPKKVRRTVRRGKKAGRR